MAVEPMDTVVVKQDPESYGTGLCCISALEYTDHKPIKEEVVKEEIVDEYEDRLTSLYPDHVVKDEVVLGPERLQPADITFRLHAGTPKMVERPVLRDGVVRLERVIDYENVLPARSGAEGRVDQSGRSGAEGRVDQSGRSGAEGRVDQSGRSGAEGRVDQSGQSGAEARVDQSGRSGAEGRVDQSGRSEAESQGAANTMDDASDVIDSDGDIPSNPQPTETMIVTTNIRSLESGETNLKAFGNFESWRNMSITSVLSENDIIAYFRELASYDKPTTLWVVSAMLKRVIKEKHNINVNCGSLMTYLEKKSNGYRNQKMKTLTNEDVMRFLKEAPDRHFLAMKVALIFGMHGACRMTELTNMHVNDITSEDDLITVKKRDANTYIESTFVIPKEFVPIVRKYQALRPKNHQGRFFLCYNNGRCWHMPIGAISMKKIPVHIAKYLKLGESERYSGECFRRSCGYVKTLLNCWM